ncbi:Similar to CNOT10: CCR4-NOT transcription complex subunit 10 (Gallus gallus) [Cotesia congregata]|uniref:CCR4-NOT transcription complex subunit 10 n=1 Tax=Cotesia congregata TaxID=51543 RepID=A0A8J2MJZ9_COTCN|nr:Similar to CNOT10: CCR4-NOT transcription complex subunit 10 (Gallus gallus) [Cotesia congregata]
MAKPMNAAKSKRKMSETEMMTNGCSKDPSNTAIMITEQERDLANSALNEFKKRNYISCLTYLNKLEALRPKDLKVMHNKIIVEYYKSDLTKTELARKSLNAICGSPSSPVTVTSSEDAGDTASDGTDDAEKCVMRYNQAVLLYHNRQYDLALQILEKLFSFVEPMEENLAWKVCLFLIELYIQTNRLALALALVNYVENQFICSNVADTKINAASSSSSSINLEKEKDKETCRIILKEKKNDNWLPSNSDSNNEMFRIKLLKYKVRLLLLLQHPKLCKKEWKLLMSLTGNSSPGAEVEKVGSISTVFLKAHLEYVKGNYGKSMTLLNSCTGSSADLDYKIHGESAAVIYYNNIACVHFARGKPNLAAFYLKRALVENKKAIDAARVKDNNSNNSGSDSSAQFLYTLGAGDKHHELMFNLGVALLGANQATKAFDCFTEAARGCTRLHNSPELWLRMAECCIHCYKPSNKIDFDMTTRRQRPTMRSQRGRCQDLVQKAVGGVGQHRKLILASALNKDSRYHTQSLAYAMPQPTLEFAMLCLKNALFTLSRSPYEEATDKSAKSMLITPPSSFLSEGNTSAGLLSSGSTLATGIAEDSTTTPMNAGTTIQILQAKWMSEAISLKIAILAASAYVSLCLGDYILALEHARMLLKIDSLPGAYKMLGNLYAAERILRYNLAVSYAIRGELDKSGETLKQVWLSKGPDCDVPIHVIMLALYIELQLGHDEVARSIVKQHCPQYWA